MPRVHLGGPAGTSVGGPQRLDVPRQRRGQGRGVPALARADPPPGAHGRSAGGAPGRHLPPAKHGAAASDPGTLAAPVVRRRAGPRGRRARRRARRAHRQGPAGARRTGGRTRSRRLLTLARWVRWWVGARRPQPVVRSVPLADISNVVLPTTSVFGGYAIGVIEAARQSFYVYQDRNGDELRQWLEVGPSEVWTPPLVWCSMGTGPAGASLTRFWSGIAGAQGGGRSGARGAAHGPTAAADHPERAGRHLRVGL